MNDKPKVILGLVVALIVLMVPFWYALATGRPDAPPQLDLPDGLCVEERQYMRSNHMDLLDQWRNQVVREGDDRQIEISGHKYHKSLTKGCMACHVSRENFCARCHDYADVRPTCWDCHAESKEN